MKNIKNLWILLSITTTIYAWEINGIPICTAQAEQSCPSIVSDGRAGAIIMWGDIRSITNNFDIYVQRVDRDGNILWTYNGVSICSNPYQQYPVPGVSLVSDGSGGAIAVWTDFRIATPDIYAQRIDSNGTALWTPNGIPVCAVPGYQLYPVAVSDDAGGVIVAWYDGLAGQGPIYAQRISPDGNCLWTPGGVQIAAPPAIAVYEDAYRPLGLVRDGFNGAIIAWKDERSGSGNSDVYAQRVDSNGNVLWTPSGVPVCTNSANQMNIAVTGTGNGNAIITWSDSRNGNYDIWAQRVDSTGIPQWTVDGIPVCNAVWDQMSPKITDDGVTGAIIAWTDQRETGPGPCDLYAQRIDSSGNPIWQANGILVIYIPNDSFTEARHSIINDGAGGAVISLSVTPWSIDWDIYAQWVNLQGDLIWGETGLQIAQLSGNQVNPFATLTTPGDAIIVWFDQRNDDGDIYAQSTAYAGIEENHNSEVKSKIFLSVNPNPFSRKTEIRYSILARPASQGEAGDTRYSLHNISIKIYDATGRLVKNFLLHPSFFITHNSITWFGDDDFSHRVPTGVYFLKLQAGSNLTVKKITLLK